jgi:hypothetical protein
VNATDHPTPLHLDYSCTARQHIEQAAALHGIVVVDNAETRYWQGVENVVGNAHQPDEMEELLALLGEAKIIHGTDASLLLLRYSRERDAEQTATQ